MVGRAGPGGHARHRRVAQALAHAYSVPDTDLADANALSDTNAANPTADPTANPNPAAHAHSFRHADTDAEPDSDVHAATD
jgi:hypothetical protein